MSLQQSLVPTAPSGCEQPGLPRWAKKTPDPCDDSAESVVAGMATVLEAMALVPKARGNEVIAKRPLGTGPTRLVWPSHWPRDLAIRHHPRDRLGPSH